MLSCWGGCIKPKMINSLTSKEGLSLLFLITYREKPAPSKKACGLFSTAYLQVGELAKGLGADVAFILDLPVLLLQWVWEGFVTGHIPLTFNEIHGFFTAGGSQHH